jgi:hypothetical protein
MELSYLGTGALETNGESVSAATVDRRPDETR